MLRTTVRRTMRLHHKRRRTPTRRSRPARGTKETISTQQPWSSVSELICGPECRVEPCRTCQVWRLNLAPTKRVLQRDRNVTLWRKVEASQGRVPAKL